MKVKNKSNNKIFDVYDIKYNKSGYPHFLIYEDGQWKIVSAKFYIPYNENYI